MRNPRVLCNIHVWQLALVLVPVYFIKHSVSCYIYYMLYVHIEHTYVVI